MPFVIGRKEFEVTYDICEHCNGTGEIDDGREMPVGTLDHIALSRLAADYYQKPSIPEPPKQDNQLPDLGDSGRRIIID